MSKHSMQIRVRYKETDQMGVVYYSNYLVWFEVVRTEFFRARGIGYREIEERDKIYLPVTEVHCRYRVPLKYDDLLTVETELTDIRAARITFEYKVTRGDKLMAAGKTKHVFVNEKGKPISIPEKIKKAISK